MARSGPRAGEVRVRVAASCVNFTDVLSTSGRSQLARPLPMIPGVEAAGTIDAVGPDVTRFAVGDRVLCVVMAGGFADMLIATVDEVAQIPDAMSFEDAAAFYIASFTTYHALVTRAALGKGESLLVVGAGGGAGLAAVQMGKAIGAFVVAAASSEDKLAIAREAGADAAIRYPEGPLDRQAQVELTEVLMASATSQRAVTIGFINSVANRAGFDVVFDGVGGTYAEPAIRALAWEGRYLSVGFAGGVPSVKLGPLLFKNATLHGIQPSEPEYRLPSLARENLRQMFAWYQAGQLVPQITERIPLARAPEAMRMLLDRTAKGRVILTMD